MDKSKLKEKLIQYINAIKDYEIYIKTIYKSHKENFNYHEGYIVNLKDFKNLKECIKYEVLKENNSYLNNFEEKIQINSIPTIRQIRINNSQDFIKAINNQKEYIILNKTLYHILSKDDNIYGPFFHYFIDDSKLSLILENSETVFFKLNNNILNEKSLIQTKSEIIISNSELIDYFEAIIEYYNFNLEIFFALNCEINPFKEKGYLVDLNWINELKKKIFYEDIKKEFFNSSHIDEKEKSHLKNKIINFLSQKEIGKIKLNPLELPYFESINSFNNYIQLNSLTIASCRFYHIMTKILKLETKQKQLVEFRCSKSKIEINLCNSLIIFITKNNALSFNSIEKKINIKSNIKNINNINKDNLND